jgi:hypothetical protein
MKLNISVRSANPNVAIDIIEGKIAEGITVKRPKRLMEMVNPPIDYYFIIEGLAVQVAATIIANYLWEKLKNNKANELTIGNQVVKIDAQKIEQIVIINLNEEK